MIMHQLYYQTNIKKFNALGAIFQFYISCTIRGHLESNFNMQSKSSNFYIIYINTESIKSKSSVEAEGSITAAVGLMIGVVDLPFELWISRAFALLPWHGT